MFFVICSHLQLEQALNAAKEEYQDMFSRIEFERAEYEQEIDNAQYEITTRDENIKVSFMLHAPSLYFMPKYKWLFIYIFTDFINHIFCECMYRQLLPTYLGNKIENKIKLNESNFKHYKIESKI